jgi:hypothetical protein
MTTNSIFETMSDTIKDTKLPRLPIPFSIESLISNNPSAACALNEHHKEQIHSNFANIANSYHTMLPFPNLPMYNPWVGYLSQTSSHLFNNGAAAASADDKSSPLEMLDNSTQHNNIVGDSLKESTNLSSVLMSQTMADSRYIFNSVIDHNSYKEKLAQYFVNNIRDNINNDRMNDLLCDYNSFLSEKESVCNGKSPNALTGDLSKGLLLQHQNLYDHSQDKDVDIESGDSCTSDLSLTSSPDGSQKLRGKNSNDLKMKNWRKKINW